MSQNCSPLCAVGEWSNHQKQDSVRLFSSSSRSSCSVWLVSLRAFPPNVLHNKARLGLARTWTPACSQPAPSSSPRLASPDSEIWQPRASSPVFLLLLGVLTIPLASASASASARVAPLGTSTKFRRARGAPPSCSRAVVQCKFQTISLCCCCLSIE